MKGSEFLNALSALLAEVPALREAEVDIDEESYLTFHLPIDGTRWLYVGDTLRLASSHFDGARTYQGERWVREG
jgi:hypothetical protein